MYEPTRPANNILSIVMLLLTNFWVRADFVSGKNYVRNFCYTSYMVVLGIDPGLASVGWAIVEGTKSKVRLIDHGLISTSKNTGFDQRLIDIFSAIQSIIKNSETKPSIMAMEELFFAKNAKTAMKVGQAIGAIKLAGSMSGIPIVEYTPLNIKTTIAGYGKADKEQMIYMVAQTLNLKDKLKSDHTADAAAVALTHIYTNSTLKI